MVWFNSKKEAFDDSCCREDFVCEISNDVWDYYAGLEVGKFWDIVNGSFVALKSIEDVLKFCVAHERIAELKDLLASTDYKVQKYMEGQLTEEEWSVAKADRQRWRDEINGLEELINGI